MPGNHDPLAEAMLNAQRMATHAEESAVAGDPSVVHFQVGETLRYGEMARSFVEEVLDSTDDEHVVLYGGQALESIEGVLDQASQALFSSEVAARKHVQAMAAHADRSVAELNTAMGQEAA